MADISLVIDVKQNGVTSAVKNTKTLESNVKLLSDRFKSGSLSQRQYYKGLLQLAQASGKSEAELRKYAAQIRAAERASARATAAARAEAKAVRDYANARRQANAENQRMIAVERAAAAAARSTADANRRLRMEFREGYAAQVALRAAQMRLNQARRQGIITDEEYRRGLDRLGDSSQRGTRHMSRAGVAMQQTGYQVGDFLVQIQGGTNPMVAFGQQATQLVGVLYMLPAATLAGSVGIMGLTISVGLLIASLGIIIPLATALGAAWMRTRKANDEVSKSVVRLEKSIGSLDSTLQDWITTRKAAQAGITVDELLSLDSIKDAESALSDATDQLERFRLARENIANTPEGAAVNFLTGLFTDPEGAEEEAIQKLEDARKRLATLRQKQSEDMQANFQEEYQSQVDFLDLQVKIAKFGEDSRAVRSLELQQDIDSYARQIDLQVRQNELTVAHGEALKRVQEESARLEYNTRESAEILSGIFASGLDAANTKMSELADKALTLRDRLFSAAGAAYAVAQDAHAKLLRDQSVGRGRGMSAGPTADEINTNNIAAQLATTEANERERLRKLAEAAAKKSSGSSGQDPAKKLAAYLNNKEQELEVQRELIGLFGVERDIQEELLNIKDEYAGVITETQAKELEATLRQMEAVKELHQLEEDRKALMENIGQSVADGFTAMVEGTMTVKDAFRNMAKEIIKQLWEIFVVQQIVGVVSQAFGVPKAVTDPAVSAMMSSWDGGGYTGSGARSGGMDGKGGFMAMLHPQETVVDHTKGQSSGGTTVQQTLNFNFSANGDDSVKKIIAQAAPQIAQMTQKSMMDQRRRGGSMKSTFG